jgi:hypothetical protein
VPSSIYFNPLYTKKEHVWVHHVFIAYLNFLDSEYETALNVTHTRAHARTHTHTEPAQTKRVFPMPTRGTRLAVPTISQKQQVRISSSESKLLRDLLTQQEAGYGIYRGRTSSILCLPDVRRCMPLSSLETK